MSSTPPDQPPTAWQPPYPPAPPVPPAGPKSWFVRHKVLTGLLALLVLGVVVSALGGGGDTTTPSVAGTAPATGAPTTAIAPATKAPVAKAPKAKAAATIGTPVRDGKFEFTVTKVQTGVASVGEDVLAQKAQGRFVLVHVTVKNIGDQGQTLLDSDQKLLDATGREFSTDTGAGILIKGNDVFLNQINPGNSVSGTLVYDMPKDATPASIELHDSMFSGGVTVSLT